MHNIKPKPQSSYKHIFIFGVMRCGTTYLATILDEHPEVCFTKPIVPEAKFFLKTEEFSRGIDYYKNNFFPYRKEVNRIEPFSQKVHILGEKTIHYYEREDAVQRISRLLPNASIIVILRDPVQRALSNYYFSVQNKLETRSLEEVFLLEHEAPPTSRCFFISPFNYIVRGLYLKGLHMIEKYFASNQIQIIIAERFFSNIEAVKDLYKRLGLEDAFSPPSLNNHIFSSEKNLNNSDKSLLNDVKSKLYNYYSHSIRKLEEYLKTELAEWKTY